MVRKKSSGLLMLEEDHLREDKQSDKDLEDFIKVLEKKKIEKAIIHNFSAIFVDKSYCKKREELIFLNYKILLETFLNIYHKDPKISLSATRAFNSLLNTLKSLIQAKE